MMLGPSGFLCIPHPTLSAELPGSLAEVPGIVSHLGPARFKPLKAQAGPFQRRESEAQSGDTLQVSRRLGRAGILSSFSEAPGS